RRGPRFRLEPELLARFGWRRDLRAELPAHARGFRNELAVGFRHPSFLQIEVVFEADPYVAAHRDGSGGERPLREADADHLPVRLWRQRVDLVDEVAGGGGDAAEHAHDEAELIRRIEDSLVDERAGV